MSFLSVFAGEDSRKIWVVVLRVMVMESGGDDGAAKREQMV